MFFTFEISRPFQWHAGFWRCAGITSWRIWWGWFALSCHPMRYDVMIDLASSGTLAWHKRRLLLSTPEADTPAEHLSTPPTSG